MSRFSLRQLFSSVESVAVTLLVGSAIAGHPARSLAETAGNEPYLVYVATDAANLRCGPAEEFYKTEPLRHGQELEVYVATDDGWLGVRPVADSFCWVDAGVVNLEKAPDPRSRKKVEFPVQGVVSENKTVAWIGTNLGRARRYRWQVQLAEGEPVTVVGRSEREGPDGPQTWYRIVPPSGEFRWLHQNQVVYSAEELVAGLKQSTDDDIVFLPGETGADLHEEPEALIRPKPLRRDSFASSTDDEPLNEQESETEHHHPRSFSQRITGGIAALTGRGSASDSDTEAREFQDAMPSSRRVVDLIPIEGRDHASDVVGTGVELGTPIAAETLRVTPSIAQAIPTPLPVAAPAPEPIVSTLPNLANSSLAITSRPRLGEPSSPAVTSVAADTTWAARTYDPPPAIAVSANSAIQPVGYTQSRSPATVPSPVRSISSLEIDEVKRQVKDADPHALAMVFSKLIARGATAPEVAVLVEAADRAGATDLASRGRDYQAIARRRDGETFVQTAAYSAMNVPGLPPTTTRPELTPRIVAAAPTPAKEVPVPAAVIPTHSGTLVQVYSADPNRPPYALTDQGGRTLAYVTPAPGIDFLRHLGSQVRISGESGYLQGLDTPHILATQITR